MNSFAQGISGSSKKAYVLVACSALSDAGISRRGDYLHVPPHIPSEFVERFIKIIRKDQISFQCLLAVEMLPRSV